MRDKDAGLAEFITVFVISFIAGAGAHLGWVLPEAAASFLAWIFS